MDQRQSSDGLSRDGWSSDTFDFTFKESEIATTLTLPQYVREGVAAPSALHAASDKYSFNDRLAQVAPRLRELKPVILTFGISLIFAILYCWFIIVVLINGTVETPLGVFWDASKTNLVVSVLSQMSAFLTDATLKAFLGVLRNAFLAQDGSSFASYVGLGEASGYLSVFQVAAMEWFINPWCDFRYDLPSPQHSSQRY